MEVEKRREKLEKFFRENRKFFEKMAKNI